MAIVTVDVESDWGGRTNTLHGIENGIPKILDTLDEYGIKAIFFISTKYLHWYLEEAQEIVRRNHVIGSHGHEHRVWRGRDWLYWWDDFDTSRKLIYKYLGEDINSTLYRAPKFSRVLDGMTLSNPTNHVSVLKHSWVPHRITDDTIFYIHPFDIVEHHTPAPNLMCRLLYIHPQKVYQTFRKVCAYC